MIVTKELFIKELLAKFKVIKVNYEPHCESIWYLQYDNYDVFSADEVGCSLEEDEKLIGQEIEAQISLLVDKVHKIEAQEKTFAYDQGDIIVSGIYKEIIKTEILGEIHTSYVLDSIFPIKISDIPHGAKIGDWLIANGLPFLDLPREKAPNWR